MHSSNHTHDCKIDISCHQNSASAFQRETHSHLACSQNYEPENSTFTEKVIREIAEEDLTPIGFMGSDLRENIQYFIQNRNLDIHTDISKIIDALKSKLIIRSRNGGVCFKTFHAPCIRSRRSGQLLCASHSCPNHFHFYYMADTSYQEFRSLQAAYNNYCNEDNIETAQEILRKIKNLLERVLIPELEELFCEIRRKGKDHILFRNPSLRLVISHYSIMQNEMELWMQHPGDS